MKLFGGLYLNVATFKILAATFKIFSVKPKLKTILKLLFELDRLEMKSGFLNKIKLCECTNHSKQNTLAPKLEQVYGTRALRISLSLILLLCRVNHCMWLMNFVTSFMWTTGNYHKRYSIIFSFMKSWIPLGHICELCLSRYSSYR